MGRKCNVISDLTDLLIALSYLALSSVELYVGCTTVMSEYTCERDFAYCFLPAYLIGGGVGNILLVLIASSSECFRTKELTCQFCFMLPVGLFIIFWWIYGTVNLGSLLYSDRGCRDTEYNKCSYDHPVMVLMAAFEWGSKFILLLLRWGYRMTRRRHRASYDRDGGRPAEVQHVRHNVFNDHNVVHERYVHNEYNVYHQRHQTNVIVGVSGNVPTMRTPLLGQ